MSNKFDTTKLAPIPQLRKLSQALATLDAILMPNWQYRYYSYQRDWSENLDLFSMRNGSGDHFIIIFQPSQGLIKGFAHESLLSPYSHVSKAFSVNLLEELPQSFARFLAEPALSFQETTFCLWRTQNDVYWQYCKTDRDDINALDDGSNSLLFILDGEPATYHQWAIRYYGVEPPINAINAIYNHLPLTQALAKKLNPLIDWRLALIEVAKTGYPLGFSRHQG